MGWDAQSTGYSFETRKYVNRKVSKEFRQISAAISLITGTVDGDLITGGLGCSKSRYFLEKATGLICYIDWDAADTVMIAAKANWNIKYKIDDAWAYQSAKLFLETCAKFELAVNFSF